MLPCPHAARVCRGAQLAPLLLAVALAGCGSSGNGVASKSPTAILAASRAAAEGAASVRVADKSSQGRLSLTLNMEATRDGGRARVSLLALVFEVIRSGDTLYIKGNPAFYARLGIAAAKVPKGMWLKASASSRQLAQLTEFTNLSGELGTMLTARGPLTKGAATTANGQQVIELKENTGVSIRTLYIATNGKPYPIKIVKHGAETGQATFSDWNQPIKLTPPASAVELSKLEHER